MFSLAFRIRNRDHDPQWEKTNLDRRQRGKRMVRLHWCLGLVCAVAVASGNFAPAEKDKPKDNTPPDGFKLLFNGKDLDGWKGLVDMKKRAELSPEKLAEAQEKADAKLKHWTVEKGVLRFDGNGENLVTAK